MFWQGLLEDLNVSLGLSLPQINRSIHIKKLNKMTVYHVLFGCACQEKVSATFNVFWHLLLVKQVGSFLNSGTITPSMWHDHTTLHNISASLILPPATASRALGCTSLSKGLWGE
jgi:hypothetical protein